jgi:hypothetical protein
MTRRIDLGLLSSRHGSHARRRVETLPDPAHARAPGLIHPVRSGHRLAGSSAIWDSAAGEVAA